MRFLVILVAVGLALSACGRKGDPAPPSGAAPSTEAAAED